MSKWNKYIGLEYNFGSHNLERGTDCLRLIEEALKQEKNFHLKENGNPVMEDWYINNPERLIKEAVKRGEVIKDITQLREFDLVFFKMKNIIRHMGIMTDNYGHFLHQLEKRPSRQDSINARHWQKRFFCGIRIKYD